MTTTVQPLTGKDESKPSEGDGGIVDKAVTSLDKELGRKVDEQEVKQKLKKHFSELFLAQFI